MTNSEVAKMIKVGQIVSRKKGIAWLMSNKEEVKVAYTDKEKEFEKNHGYFVACIFENGNIVEA